MYRLALCCVAVLFLVGCDRITTSPPTPEQQQPMFAAAAAGGGAPFQEVAAGDLFSCALNARGDVYCWGGNSFGTLGSGDLVDATTPRPLIGGVAFAAISANGFHACGLAHGGDAYCWGQNASRELGGQQ